MKSFFIALLNIYKLLISPFFEQLGIGNCRYEETCSMYMKRQIEKKGVKKGIILGLKRLSTCHPFAKYHAEIV